MINLAYTPPKEDQKKAEAISSSEPENPQYPSLRFNGEQAKKAGLTNCRFGEEYEITVRVKATRIDGSYSYPGSGIHKDEPAVEFDVLTCDEPKEVESKEEDKGEKEEEEYERPKTKIERGPKEAGMLK